MGRIIGLDYGRARIGVAVSDERKIIASPFAVIEMGKNARLAIQNMQKKLSTLGSIDLCVIGLPLLLNGKEGEMALEVKAFAKILEEMLSLPVVLWDERLTSAQADRLMKEDHRSRKERAKSIDTLAATLILQNYLDTPAKLKPQNSPS